jgi:hypothetical protein
VIFRLRFGRLGTREILGSIGKIALCAAIMGVVCWCALHYSRFDDIQHFLPRVVAFVGLILSATLTYLGLAWILRCDEVGELYGIAMHRDQAEAGTSGLTG